MAAVRLSVDPAGKIPRFIIYHGGFRIAIAPEDVYIIKIAEILMVWKMLKTVGGIHPAATATLVQGELPWKNRRKPVTCPP